MYPLVRVSWLQIPPFWQGLLSQGLSAAERIYREVIIIICIKGFQDGIITLKILIDNQEMNFFQPQTYPTFIK